MAKDATTIARELRAEAERLLRAAEILDGKKRPGRKPRTVRLELADLLTKDEVPDGR